MLLWTVELTRGGDETVDVISVPGQFSKHDGECRHLNYDLLQFCIPPSDPDMCDVWVDAGFSSVLSPEEDVQLEDYLRQVRQLPLYKIAGVSLLDRALVYHRESASYEQAFEKAKNLSPKSLGFVTWSESDSHKMDGAIQDLGEDLRGMMKHFPKKTSGDIASFYYIIKGYILLSSYFFSCPLPVFAST